MHNPFCTACQARLPRKSGRGSARDLPGTTSASRHLQRLSAENQWQNTLTWFRGLYTNVRRQRKRPKPPPADTPPEQLELLQKAADSLNQGLKLILAGSEKLLEMPGWLEEAAQIT